MNTDLATRSIDAMVARIDEALAEPREPFAWMPVLREHASADVPGLMTYDGEALSPPPPPPEITRYGHGRFDPWPVADRAGHGRISMFFDEVQRPTPQMWALIEATIRAPYRMIGGSNA